uniref:hypothetical protein n=1 Tax=Flavobacterium sp. TaxID=239 RepID=UPI0040499F48
MTPKEKAKQLVEKYKFYLGNEDEHTKEAKDLSLICVNEIINLDIDVNVLDYWWWKEVEIEIESL